TRALVGLGIFSFRAKWRSSSERMPWCARKVLDTADIVREAMLRKLIAQEHRIAIRAESRC
ncbi:MAG: hypothetical protein ABSC64_19990, partial [Candidatus Korobacteraceae bacterium]